MHIKSPKEFPGGINKITEIEGQNFDMMMGFSVLHIKKGESYANEAGTERVVLLITGSVEIYCNFESYSISRKSCFDGRPFVFHSPKGVKFEIKGISHNSEIAIIETENERDFLPVLYSPDDIRSEHRGEGTLNETSTRIVRTVFDKKNSPFSNLVLGEVITIPGKWSSYPPHHHPQPEIYFYKFSPENGFGYSQCGDDVFKVENNSTVLIKEGMVHPQTAAPGYAMWYLWVIRHLDDNPYLEPEFVPEHLWTTKKDAKIWGSREEWFISVN